MKEGDKVKCIAHTGHEPFWEEGFTPKIGEVCTLGEFIGRYKEGDAYKLIEYLHNSEGYDIAFNMRDFELYEQN